MIESFGVPWDDIHKVHASIRFTLNLQPLAIQKRVVNKAGSFHDKLSEMVREEFCYLEYDVFSKQAWERWHGHLTNVNCFM